MAESINVLRASLRWLAFAGLGAGLGVLSLLITYGRSPALTLEMDRPFGALATGWYPPERVERETFAWSGRTATLELAGLDRRVAWVCEIRLRGGRPDGYPLPSAMATVDGIVVARMDTTNDFADLVVPVPAATGRRNTTLGLTLSNTFRPGSDPRDLGAMIDGLSCAPEAGATPGPPAPALTAAALIGAAFGLALAVVGFGLIGTALPLIAMTALAAFPLSHALGPFGGYPEVATTVGLAVAALLAASTGLVRLVRGAPASWAARAALVATAVIMAAKLLALLHPSKFEVDAVFHAHRLQWVLEGRLLFTQVMPSGVTFPYAIGLYVFAAPWTALTTDFVTLLRVIVVGAEAAAGLLACLLVMRYWRSPVAAVTVAVLLGVVPRTFEIVGNANLTNAFGQSMAFAALTVVTLARWGTQSWRTWITIALVTAAAMLCHVSTLTLLGGILGALVVLEASLAGPEGRARAIRLGSAVAAAVVIAVAVYYGHFMDAYRSAMRVSSAGENTVYAGLWSKVSDTLSVGLTGTGWPLLILGAVGAPAVISFGRTNRLTLTIGALVLSAIALAGAVIVMPVEASFQRYNAEFFSRVVLATYPALVLSAALGAARLWERGGLWRLASALGVCAALGVGLRAWAQWLLQS